MTFNAYMHERNIYRHQPDFAKLASDFPEFQKYIITDVKGQKARVDFSNTEALRILTTILLKKDFNLDLEIPEGFLIPTVPQRLNYILWLEDLLSSISPNEPQKKSINGIDIGTGACAIFSILGAKKNGWKFIATESSSDAIMWAKKNIEKNNLHEYITVVKVNQDSSLEEVLSSNVDCFDFCMCNPPFFDNSEEIRRKHPSSDETIADVAQKDEIFFKGGELDFVRNIVKDSLVYKNRICLFTSMFGKKKSFLQILNDLKEIPDVKCTTTEFCQGNTIRWGIAWTFDQSVEFPQKAKKREKPKKAKPPLEYQISLNSSKKANLDTVVKQAKNLLKSLEIPFTVVRSSQNFTELLLKSDKNTWTHQRRKRRELERHNKEGKNVSENATVHSHESIKTLIKDDDKKSFEKISILDDSEVVPISAKTDAIVKDCDTDIQVSCRESKKNNTPDNAPFINISSGLESQSQISSHNVSEAKCSKGKRKLDIDSEESSTHKKAKLDATETVLFEDCVNKSSVLKSESEIISVCKVDTHSSSSSNDTSSIKSDTNLQSKTEKESWGGDIKELEKNVFHKKTVDTEPEGLLLYCYLQFIKGKNKVYVKMNCPPSADRNTMYQVFQLLKNKVNNF